MSDTTDRDALIVELRRNHASLEQIAEQVNLSPARVSQILSTMPRSDYRHRGRPCPNVCDGERCYGGSKVLKVWQDDEQDAGIRLRECLVCGHRWLTEESNVAAEEKST